MPKHRSDRQLLRLCCLLWLYWLPRLLRVPHQASRSKKLCLLLLIIILEQEEALSIWL